MMLIIFEGLVMCFLLLITCVIGIANGPVGLVVLYEQDVQDRAIELGYTSKDKIRRCLIITSIAMFLPMLVLVPVMVYGINGVSSFRDGFWQMIAIHWITGLFDRLFIDWHWVGHTKAWIIPVTEDLQPYIPGKVLLRKWLGTIFLYPAISAITAYILSFF